MRLFGFELARVQKAQSLSAVNANGGWVNLIRESFSGAWQRNVKTDSARDILAYSAVFASVTVIAQDIAKLAIGIVREDADGICTPVRSSPFLAVLRKPNTYQNRIKFIEQWIISKLLYGNTYALKVRDARGIVTRLYVLDSQRVSTLVADDGSVFYQLSSDNLSGIMDTVVVPAREIIHDMMVSLWHPLVGVSPIYACAVSATQGNAIQANSTKFFDNMSRPSGMLSAPASISDEVAGRLKQAWEENFGGSNIGRLAVLGDGLKYEPMTIPAQEAQLIQQQEWTVKDVGRCFHVPLYKIGGDVPGGSSIEALNQMYYSDCLQALIESAELCLDEGIGLPQNYFTQFDLDGLIRMDTAARFDAKNKAIAGGWMAPNEARAGENLKPVEGGDSPMIQQQNYSLAALAKRDAQADPFATAAPAAPSSSTTTQPTEDTEDDDETPNADELDEQAAAMFGVLQKRLQAKQGAAHAN